LKAPAFAYAKPASLAEALDLLARLAADDPWRGERSADCLESSASFHRASLALSGRRSRFFGEQLLQVLDGRL
jgi:hypothetical protein